jgi:hypothetical protein
MVFKEEKSSVYSTLERSARMKEHKYLSKENYLCQKQEHQVHCCPVRIELVFERNFLKIIVFKVDEVSFF